jgi:hypothetical protein
MQYTRGQTQFPLARAHSDITYGGGRQHENVAYGGGSPRKTMKKRSRARTLGRVALLLITLILLGAGLHSLFCSGDACLPSSVKEAYNSADWNPSAYTENWVKAPWRDAVEGSSQWVGGGAAIAKAHGGKEEEGLLVLGEGYALDQEGGVVTDNEVGDEADVLVDGVEEHDEKVMGSKVGKTGEMEVENGTVSNAEDAKEEAKGMLGSMEMELKSV